MTNAALGSSPPCGGLNSTSWTFRRALLAALAVGILASFTGVFDHSLWTPDEPRDAEIGREMLASRDFVVPTLAGEPFLEKPPLYWWVMAGFYRVFGVSDGVARSASALAGVLTLLLVFDLARRITNPFSGLMATVVVATMSGFYAECHRVVVDSWLALFVMLGYWGFVVAVLQRESPKAENQPAVSPLGIAVMYLAGGLAFLTKGLVGPGLLAGPVLVAIVLGRQWRFLRSWVHVPGLLVFLALCLMWPAMLYERGGKGLMDGFVLSNLLHRFSASSDYAGGHRHPFWYYMFAFPAEVLPWLIAVPAACHWLWKRRAPAEWNRPALLFLAWVFPIGMVMLSAAGTKRGLYLLPLIAPLGSVVGAWIVATMAEGRREKIDRTTQAVMLAVLVAASAGLVISSAFAGQITRVFMGHEAAPLLAQVSKARLALLAVLGCLSLGAAIYGICLYRRDSARVGPLIAGLVLALVVLALPLVLGVIDPFKNLHPMTADLKRLNAFSPALATYRMDEVTQGIIPYDTGIMLRRLDNPDNPDDPSELRRFIRENPTGKILLLERNLRFIPEDLRGRWRLIQRWRYSKHRIYCLYDFDQPGSLFLLK